MLPVSVSPMRGLTPAACGSAPSSLRVSRSASVSTASWVRATILMSSLPMCRSVVWLSVWVRVVSLTPATTHGGFAFAGAMPPVYSGQPSSLGIMLMIASRVAR